MNTNCLENRACPACGYADEVLIVATMWVSLTDDGTDPYADSVEDTGVEYDEASECKCPNCGHEGYFEDWSTP